MPYIKYSWKVESESQYFVRMKLAIEGVKTEFDGQYVQILPFNNQASWNFIRKFFPYLIGVDGLENEIGLPEELAPGTYEKVIGGTTTITTEDLLLGNVLPTGQVLPGRQSDERRSFYSGIFADYYSFANWEPPGPEPLDDPARWSLPWPFERFDDCPKFSGGGGAGGGGGASGGWAAKTPEENQFPGRCLPGQGTFRALWNSVIEPYEDWYNDRVYIPYFSEEVAQAAPAWVQMGDMMQSVGEHYTDIRAIIYNQVRYAGFEWYAENITEEPLENFDFKTGPLNVIPQGYYLYCRVCPVPSIYAKVVATEDNPLPISITKIVIEERELIKNILKRQGFAMVWLPYDLSFNGKKTTFNNKQLIFNKPEE